jgi:Flp pilus assembly protein TadG
MRERHSERGTTLPEMALVIGVLLALVFGIIDFGRGLYTYGLVADMARKAARYAIVRGSLCTRLGTGCPASSADILTYVRSLSQGATDPTQITVDGATGGANYVAPIWPGTPITTCNAGKGTGGGNNAAGCYVVVTVRYPFSFILPYMPKGTKNCGLSTASICISSTSQMLISQ